MSSDTDNFSRRRQSQIYLDGLGGSRPAVPVSWEQLRHQAERKMDRKACAYVTGGAGRETTAYNNRRAFDRWKIVPRMLRDVSERETGAELFGHRYPAPVLLAPIGVLELMHPEADLAAARAAAAEEIPMVFSSQASVPMEACAEAMDGAPRWFQLYWSTSNDLVESFVRRAERCGCQAVVLTLDTTMLGWRTRDLDLAYLPFLEAKGIAQYTSDPVFRELMGEYGDEDPERKKEITFSSLRALVRMSRSYPGPFLRNLVSGEPLRAVRTFIRTYSRPSLTWDDLAFLRDLTDLPILLKGILHPGDARRAVEYGMNGIVVSNHGGRQVDGAIASLDALPGVVEAVEGRIPVLLDSGIRTGSDIFKALALGAEAVFLGRPWVYGLALAGERGVREVIRNARAELELTMGLAGIRNLDGIDRNALEPSSE